jgi:hypothetical protein
MAAAKVIDIQLTKPNKKTNGRKPKLEITGHTKLVQGIRRRNQKIESLQAENEIDKQTLIGVCKDERRDAEKDGDLFKTCLVSAGKQPPAKVTFTNKYKQIDTSHEEQLREALDGSYDSLFETKHTIKLRNPSDFARLKELLGDELFRLLEVTPFIAPKQDFMERRAQMRPTLSEQTNDVLDTITDQAQFNPIVSVK